MKRKHKEYDLSTHEFEVVATPHFDRGRAVLVHKKLRVRKKARGKPMRASRVEVSVEG